jgi:hypothetical protein
LGRRAPLLSATWRRGIGSAAFSLPVAILAFTVADKGHISDWLRAVICPGWSVGLGVVHGEPCGGLLDCMEIVASAAGRAAGVIIAVNAAVYGLLIFGIATVLAALRQQDNGPRIPRGPTSK